MSINIGSVYQSNRYGSVVILEKSKRTDYYMVRFLNTGTEKEFRSWQIRDGCIRDPYAIDVCGVACTGNIKTKGKYKPYYSVWHDMINMCYNANNKQYVTYSNVTVCNRWLVFENFYNDASLIDGYDDEKIRSGSLVLDKDLKQRHCASKVYSPEMCTWVSKHENSKVQDAQQTWFYAKSPDGAVYTDFNITDFANKHGLDRRHISGCLHGRCKTHRGWVFSYKEIV